jgi:hypothetical protein
MLIATIAALIMIFSGGGGLELYLTNLKEAVKANVEQKGCRKEILATSKALSKELVSLSETIESHFDEVVAVHAEYGSAAQDFDVVIAKLVADQEEASRLILDAREAMHAQMTKAEWEAVFAPQESDS